uniref:cytochrome c oxidase subunit III n=1 Tax=Cheiloneurus chinensis TaxID=3082044 RepID=UPI002A7FAA0A|nr:cytochrome c oxidase subunit III [Cheiloneurus chinensis]WOE90951.1 cytochrome c oxidase subunit III [Cheiloneurus chinensis]
MKNLFQPFHLVTISPWPVLMSFSLLNILVGFVFWFFLGVMIFIELKIIALLLCLYQWWRDVVWEGQYQGFHSSKVVSGLKLGMVMFIISEVFFFFSIFWCYFHMFLSPSVELGGNWPPEGLEVFNPYSIPLLNTIILLSSGVSVTWSHYSMMLGNKKNSELGLIYTLLLGVIFSLLQLYEYISAEFTFSDSVYGSIFFMSTGFHGMHVLVGTCFLFVNWIRMKNLSFSSSHHLGFEAAIWYWHFVDVVWLFLYLLVYYWCW